MVILILYLHFSFTDSMHQASGKELLIIVPLIYEQQRGTIHYPHSQGTENRYKERCPHMDLSVIVPSCCPSTGEAEVK